MWKFSKGLLLLISTTLMITEINSLEVLGSDGSVIRTFETPSFPIGLSFFDITAPFITLEDGCDDWSNATTGHVVSVPEIGCQLEKKLDYCIEYNCSAVLIRSHWDVTGLSFISFTAFGDYLSKPLLDLSSVDANNLTQLMTSLPANTSVHIRVGDTNGFQVLSRSPLYLIFLRLVVPPIVVAMIIVPIWRFFYLRRHHALNFLIVLFLAAQTLSKLLLGIWVLVDLGLTTATLPWWCILLICLGLPAFIELACFVIIIFIWVNLLLQSNLLKIPPWLFKATGVFMFILFSIGGAITLTFGVLDVVTNGESLYMSHFFVTGIVLFFIALGLIGTGARLRGILKGRHYGNERSITLWISAAAAGMLFSSCSAILLGVAKIQGHHLLFVAALAASGVLTLWISFSLIMAIDVPHYKSVLNSTEVFMLRKLGEGFFGEVNLGTYRGELCAVKRLKPGADKKTITDFTKEIQLLQAIPPHGNVVLFLGASFAPVSIVTEYCSNGSLREYLKRAFPVPLNRKLLLLKDAAQGMVHLSAVGVVHKDLAARNILVNEVPRAKISDFGLSRLRHSMFGLSKKELKHKETVQGLIPIRWTAPEALQFLQYSSKSDVWAWAMTCMEVIEEKPPLAHLDTDSFYQGLMNDETFVDQIHGGLSTDLPPPFRELVISCLNKDPDKRPSFETISDTLNDLPIFVDEDRKLAKHAHSLALLNSGSLLSVSISDQPSESDLRKQPISNMISMSNYQKPTMSEDKNVYTKSPSTTEMPVVSGGGVSQRKTRITLADNEYFKTSDPIRKEESTISIIGTDYSNLQEKNKGMESTNSEQGTTSNTTILQKPHGGGVASKVKQLSPTQIQISREESQIETTSTSSYNNSNVNQTNTGSSDYTMAPHSGNAKDQSKDENNNTPHGSRKSGSKTSSRRPSVSNEGSKITSNKPRSRSNSQTPEQQQQQPPTIALNTSIKKGSHLSVESASSESSLQSVDTNLVKTNSENTSSQ